MKKLVSFLLSIFTLIPCCFAFAQVSFTKEELIAKSMVSYSQIELNTLGHSGEGMISTLDYQLSYKFKTHQLRNYRLFYESFESDSFCPIYCDGTPARVFASDIKIDSNYLGEKIIAGSRTTNHNDLLCNEYTANYYGINASNLPFELTLKTKSYKKIYDRKITITGIYKDSEITSSRKGMITSDFHFISYNLEFKNERYGFLGYYLAINPNYSASWSGTSICTENDNWCSFRYFQNSKIKEENIYFSNILNKKQNVDKNISLILGLLCMCIAFEIAYIISLMKMKEHFKYLTYISFPISAVIIMALNYFAKSIVLMNVFSLLITIIVFFINTILCLFLKNESHYKVSI